MSTNGNRYLLTGGGTGGHVYPAIAMADELKRREPDATFLYVGVKGKAEEKIVPARGYPITYVTSQGWPGARLSLALLLFAWRLGWGVLRALLVLRQFKPTVIIATGGYVSAPVMLAWVILKRLGMTKARAFVHEQNLVPGRLNKLVGKLADRVGVSFEESCYHFPNGLFVGYPARSEISKESREEAREHLGLPKDAKVLLAFGGSLGSRSINRAVVDALPFLLTDPTVHIVHGIGRFRGGSYHPAHDTASRLDGLSLSQEQLARYQHQEYLDPIERYYAAADLVIIRAGAGSLTEVALCGLPAVIVPKANLPGDHQVCNARALSSKGAGKVLYEHTTKQPEGLIESVEGEALAQMVQELLDDPDACQVMSVAMKEVADAGALERIVDAIQEIAKGQLPAPTELPPRQKDKPELSELSGGGLVSYLTRHGIDDLDEEEREYLAYRTDGYLASRSWQTRNVGVKLIGLLKLQDRLDLLLYIINDKTPAPGWHRLLGGDRFQVGFIRRNAMLTLQRLSVWNDDVRQALLQGLRDPYFEVRSWAARAIAHMDDGAKGDPDILKQLDELALRGPFEVMRAALRTLADVDQRPETLALLKQHFDHPNWRIREAVAFCLQRFIDRGVLTPDEVQQDLEELLVTSSGFVPHFQLRNQIRELSQTIEKSRESGCSST